MSLMTEKQFTEELAVAAASLFAKGKTKITAADITAEHYGDRGYGASEIENVRKKLIKLRDILFQNYDDMPLTLVNRTYFQQYRNRLPSSLTEARKCLATGRGNVAQGLHRRTAPDDLIWQAEQHNNYASASGKLKRANTKTVQAIDADHLSDDSARDMVQNGYRQTLPDNPAHFNELAGFKVPELESAAAAE